MKKFIIFVVLIVSIMIPTLLNSTPDLDAYSTNNRNDKPSLFGDFNYMKHPNPTEVKGEVWKDIPQCNNLYQVSSTGNVRRVAGKYSPNKDRLLKFNYIKGYCIVKFSVNAVKKNHFVHRLVGQAFIPNPHNKPIINHIDCNPANNKVENLEWVTQAENAQHTWRLGRGAYTLPKPRKGIDCHLSKLTESQVLEIRNIYASGDKRSRKEMADLYGVSQTHISRIGLGKLWAHLK